jgi:hypothetical protein
MSCLTRQLQQNLKCYLLSHKNIIDIKAPEIVHKELVERGICPSDVTPDQVSVILKGVDLS